jgi:hypothetical protein
MTRDTERGTILLLDDNVDIREFHKETLRGHRVHRGHGR